MRSFVTIANRKVAVSEITTKEKPFPFSSIYHGESTSMLENDMQGYGRDLKAFETMIHCNQQDTEYAERTREYARKNIRRINNLVFSKLMEVQYRREMCKKHNFRRYE